MPRIYEEQCELFIEQEIKEALQEGKRTPYQVGKEIAEFVEKTFGRVIKPKTVAKRMEREISDIVANDVTPEDSGEIEENRRKQDGTFTKGYSGNPAGRPPKFRCIEPAHRTFFTGENEWYTPLKYIDAAREVMGEIDIDPATSEFGQSRIKAKKYFTIKLDGLTQEWHGRVWLNPPYSQPLMAKFIGKTLYEYECLRLKEAIILTHNYTDTKWFHSLEAIAELICFTLGRIPYEKSNGGMRTYKVASPTQGAAFFYLGGNPEKFREVFGRFGFVR